MEFLIILLVALLVVGGVIAIIEHRKKAAFLRHDLNLTGPQTEASREAERATHAIRDAHHHRMIDKP